MHLLLDKNIARRYLEGVSALARGEPLSIEERRVVTLIHQAAGLGNQLGLSRETYNLLMAYGRQQAPAETLMLLRRIEVLDPTRYFKRWARRLRQRTFSREDAKILALGTFGTDQDGAILGVRSIVTLDRPMVRKWQQQGNEMAAALLEMTVNLAPPYATAMLPEVRLLEDVSLPNEHA